MWFAFLPVVLAEDAPSTGPTVDTEALYEEHCAVCHGKNGKATFPGLMMSAGSFASDRFWDDRPSERLRETIVKGGEAMGLKKAMPAFGEELTGPQIDALLAYSLAFRASD